MNNLMNRNDTSPGALSAKVQSWQENEKKLELTIKGSFPIFKKFFSRIEALYSLPQNWDSYGAETISYEAATNAVRLFCEVMLEETPMPQIVPTNKGTLQFEWHECGIDLEIDISEDGSICTFFEDLQSGKDPDEWTYGFNHGSFKIKQYMQTLAERACGERAAA
jgi:hypothetical protein